MRLLFHGTSFPGPDDETLKHDNVDVVKNDRVDEEPGCSTWHVVVNAVRSALKLQSRGISMLLRLFDTVYRSGGKIYILLERERKVSFPAFANERGRKTLRLILDASGTYKTAYRNRISDSDEILFCESFLPRQGWLYVHWADQRSCPIPPRSRL